MFKAYFNFLVCLFCSLFTFVVESNVTLLSFLFFCFAYVLFSFFLFLYVYVGAGEKMLF